MDASMPIGNEYTMSLLRAVVVAVVLSTVVVNPTIKAVYYPLAVQQDMDDAYEQCKADTDNGYECLGAM
jgi:hypothetical protein